VVLAVTATGSACAVTGVTQAMTDIANALLNLKAGRREPESSRRPRAGQAGRHWHGDCHWQCQLVVAVLAELPVALPVISGMPVFFCARLSLRLTRRTWHWHWHCSWQPKAAWLPSVPVSVVPGAITGMAWLAPTDARTGTGRAVTLTPSRITAAFSDDHTTLQLMLQHWQSPGSVVFANTSTKSA
jgi:hypothetical protein